MWNLHLEKAEYNTPFYTRGLSIHGFEYMWGVLEGFPGKESTCNTGDPGSISGLGRSPGEGIGYPLQYSWASLGPEGAFLVGQMVKNPLQCGRPGFDPWVGKVPWRRGWQPTPVFWRIPMDRGAWWATVCMVVKSWTQLSRLSTALGRMVMSYCITIRLHGCL